MQAGGSRIVVSTQSLAVAADEADHQIDRVQKAFESIEKRVEQTSSYWESRGRESFYEAYRIKTEKIMTSLARFREQSADLRTMAGIYQEAEMTVTDLMDSLASDVIV